MELKTQALDRVLEALSPALAAELDRVVADTRQTLEQEFQKRLQSAVRDVEAAASSAADAQLARAVAEAAEATRTQVTDVAESTRKQVTEELEKEFRTELADTTARLKSEASAERARLEEQLDQWRIFTEAQRGFAEASSQPEILARFLKLAQTFSAGLGLYVAKADGLALWKSRGEGAFSEIISQETRDPEYYFRTVTVRGTIVSAVCAAPPFRSDALDFLTSSLEHAIEVFGLKLKAPAPKTAGALESTVGVSRPSAGAKDVPRANTAAEPDDQKAHADARLIARLLISEIKLYHEQKLKEGREHSDIYDRLRKEIDASRKMYTHRVPGSVRTARDYFHEELIRILGENDASRMGSGYSGPMSR